MNRDSALAPRRLQHPASIAQAEPWQTDPVTLDSPALDGHDRPDEGEGGDDAARRRRCARPSRLMIYQGVRMLFVVSRDAEPSRA